MAITQTQKVIVLNNAHTAAITERTRTTSKGTSQRFTVDVVQEAIGVNLDEISAGRGIATALVEAIKHRIKTRAGKAAEWTIDSRKVAATAFAKGVQWARDRYDPAGNRMGPRAPNQSPMKFQDSGRLVDGMTSTPTRDGTFTINTAKGRFDPTAWGTGKNRPSFESVFQSFLELIDIATIADEQVVKDAIEASAARVVQRLAKGQLQLTRALSELARTTGDTFDTLDDVTSG